MRFSAFQFPSFLTLLLAICLLGSTSSSVRAADATLNRWGGFTFGMTPDQVREIPDITWGPLNTNKSQRWMFSRSPVNVDGFPFRSVEVLFDSEVRLAEIIATHFDPDVAHCELQFLKSLRSLEARHGAFVPGAKDYWRKQYDSRKVILRDLPGSQSRYEYDTLNMDTEAGRAKAVLRDLRDLLHARAKRDAGARIITVDMQVIERQNFCSIRIHFDPNVPPSAEKRERSA